MADSISAAAAAAASTAAAAGAAAAAAPAAPAAARVGPRAPREKHTMPVYRMSVKLLATYEHINEVYYTKKRARLAAEALKQKSKPASASSAAAVKGPEYQVTLGDLLGGRYRVVESLGKGSFGQVVACVDTAAAAPAPAEGAPAGASVPDPPMVAIKVIKNKESFRKQAQMELELLELLNRKDTTDQWCIVRLRESFDHGGHTCLVFEHLSFNLYELLKRTHFNGVSLNLIRKFARQILKTLAYLSLPDINVVHCDLKPENILFVNASRSAIKVIDFGSSCYANKTTYTYIQSRFYRSPEIILGLPYTQAIDMWSLGCILVELHSGSPLFSGHDEHDQMRRFIALKGMPPAHMLDAAKKTSKFFDKVDLAPVRACEGERVMRTKREPYFGAYSAAEAAGGACSSDDESGSSGASTGGDGSRCSGSEDVKASDRASDVEMDGGGGGAGGGGRARGRGGGGGAAARSGKAPPRGRPGRPEHWYRAKPYVPDATRKRQAKVHEDLRSVIGVSTCGPFGRRAGERTGHTELHYRLFLDLIERMLEYDPKKRIKPLQALNHPFLRDDDVFQKHSTAAAGRAAAVPATAVDGSGGPRGDVGAGGMAPGGPAVSHVVPSMAALSIDGAVGDGGGMAAVVGMGASGGGGGGGGSAASLVHGGNPQQADAAAAGGVVADAAGSSSSGGGGGGGVTTTPGKRRVEEVTSGTRKSAKLVMEGEAVPTK